MLTCQMFSVLLYAKKMDSNTPYYNLLSRVEGRFEDFGYQISKRLSMAWYGTPLARKRSQAPMYERFTYHNKMQEARLVKESDSSFCITLYLQVTEESGTD